MSTAEITRKPLLGPGMALFVCALVFAAIYVAVHSATAWLQPQLGLETLHQKAGFKACGSITLVWFELAGMFAVLRLRGQRFADLGWGRPARLWGWLAAIIVFAIYVGFASMGPMLKGMPVFTDWSMFRIAMALGIGISAGFCEEAIFRGFVMRQAADAKLSVTIQILLSAILFGLAHGGWGAVGPGGNFNIVAAIGATVSTAILGLLLAIAFVVGKRSLTPVMFAHGLIDVVMEPWLILFVLSSGFGS